MQQPNDPRLQQAAFRPGWMPLQEPPPPRRRGGFGRAVAVVALALLGAFLGMVTGSLAFAWSPEISVVAMLAGMWVGLAGGIWFGVAMTSRARR